MSNTKDNDAFVYVGIWHGLRVAVIVDRPEFKKETAREVGRMLRDGYVVNRETLAEFRERGMADSDSIDAMKASLRKPRLKKTVDLFDVGQ